MAEDNKINEKVEAIAGIIKAVPIYNDAIQPAAKQVGEILETVTKTIKVALIPITALVFAYEKVGDFLQEKLTQKLKNVPLENIKTPNPIVAGPVIEALKFASGDETIRELYANLLATSIDSQTAKNSHPGFVQVIGNMTPDEARIMSFIAFNNSQPLINIFYKHKKLGHWNKVYHHFSFLGKNSNCEFLDLVPNYIDNLCRLGLLYIPENVHLSEEKADNVERKVKPDKRYNELKKDSRELTDEWGTSEDYHIDFELKVLDLTSFGIQFCGACVIDKSLP